MLKKLHDANSAIIKKMAEKFDVDNLGGCNYNGYCIEKRPIKIIY